MIIDLFVIFLIFFSVVIFFTLSGCNIATYIKTVLGQKINFINPFFFGYAIFLLFLYIFYYLFNLKLNVALLFSFLILLIKLTLNFKKIIFLNINILKINFFIFLFFFIIFFTLIICYQDNFFVFRGNHWDNIYYISQAQLLNKFTYTELLELTKNSFEAIKSENSFVPFYFNKDLTTIWYNNDRPITQLIIGSLLNFNVKNIFLLHFMQKVALLTFCAFAIFSILKLLNLTILIRFYLSITFCLSFWGLFIFESESYAQLHGLPFFIIAIFISTYINKKNLSCGIFLISFFSSIVYLIYPAFAAIIFIFYLIFFFINRIYLKDIFLKKENFLYNFFFILFIITISFEQNFLNFLKVLDLLNYTSHPVDLSSINKDSVWGYYGAFVLGKDSPILNFTLVSHLKSNLENYQGFLKLKYIYNFLKINDYNFFYFNILPSLSGLYYLGVGKIGDIKYYYLISIFLLNIYLIVIFKNNYQRLSKKTSLFQLYQILFIIFLLAMFYAFIRFELFFLIKLFISYGFFIFLFLVLKFENKKINVIISFLFIFFFIYKYSLNNYGIGRYDSFPSIINKNFKENFSWNFNNLQIENCRNIYNNIKNFNNDKFQWLKFNYINVNILNFKIKNKLYDCIIEENNDKFVLKIN